jgi:nucleotide-binding universal stress UspA family protein
MDPSPQQRTGDAEPVVVGVDGSPAARAALRAALTAAADRGTGLVVLSSYAGELYWLGGAGGTAPVVMDLEVATRRLAEELVATVRSEVRGAAAVPVTVEVTLEPPAAALVGRSAGAQLVVVGDRGRGAVRSALLGSVALHTVTHARCPVLVVRPRADGPAGPPRVVTGTDGSAGSRAALAAAVEEAARAGARVEVVAACGPTDTWVDLSAVAPTREEVRDDLRARVEEAVGTVLRDRAHDARVPQVDVDVVEGAAPDVLVARARHADLLVVTTRGRGTVRGLLLGSVALHCALYAPCPVLVVRGRTRADGPDAPAPDASAGVSPVLA